MNSAAWNAFHDGGLTGIQGNLPGNIQLRIEIDYLRELFPNKGNCFIVNLTNCSSIEYCELDKSPITDIELIESKDLEILSLSSVNPVVLFCAEGYGVQGNLTLNYESASLFLDSGEPISDNELEKASIKYWNK